MLLPGSKVTSDVREFLLIFESDGIKIALLFGFGDLIASTFYLYWSNIKLVCSRKSSFLRGDLSMLGRVIYY